MIYSRNVLGVHIFHKKKNFGIRKTGAQINSGFDPWGWGGDYPDVSKPRLISYNNRCFFVGNLHLSTARNADRIG